LVYQSHVPGPKWSGKTCPAILIRRAGGLISANVIGEIRIGGNVGTVAISL